MVKSLIFLILCLREIYANTTQADFEVENRIVGGERCSVADHKYMAGIVSTDSKIFICGGSLLSSRWVLTARHCMSDRVDPNLYSAVAGVESPWELLWGENVQISAARDCYNHPTDDIGLMNLEESIELSPVVAYVTLATHFTMNGRKVEDICTSSTVVGWGLQNSVDLNGNIISNNKTEEYDPHLQCVNLPVISGQECRDRLTKLGQKAITDSNLCTYRDNFDACTGDSGGPLLCNGVQYGVVSFGYGCALKDYPGMYVKVYHFEQFIKTTMKKGDLERSQMLKCSAIKHSFLVAIIHKKTSKSFKYICDGTMLTQTWVLTYGFCVKKCETPNYYTVVAGLNDSIKFDSRDKSTLSSEVENCFQSPAHKDLWDIALMKLKTGFLQSEKVSFIRLATSLDLKNTNFEKVCSNGTLIGYGRLKNSQFHKLQCDRTTVISEKDCKKKWSLYNIGNRYGCSDEFKSENCYAALGSPLICDGIQYGVLGSAACATHKTPNFTSILIAQVYKYDKFLRKLVYILDTDKTNRMKSNGDINNPVNFYILFCFIFNLIIVNFELY